MTGGPKTYGPQPLDALMKTLKIDNHDLVEASSEQLSHKVVAKARKGRALTRRAQEKTRWALNACQQEREFTLQDLFNYSGR